MNDVKIKLSDLRKQIQQYMILQRKQAADVFQGKGTEQKLEHVIFADPRKSYLNGEYVDRLVLFLRGTGCTWVNDTGGCTFCGFWNATNFGVKISNQEYLQQVKQALLDRKIDAKKYKIISLYNDGSLFEEREIEFEVVLQICRMIAEKLPIQRIVIETKIIDLDETKIIALTQALPEIELEIAVGFESANQLVRDLCINKNFSNQIFEKNVEMLQNNGVRLVPLIIVKPPFLTEKMAIEDLVASLIYLDSFNLPRIDLELATIEQHTLMHDLWKHELYTLPRLWTVCEVLKRRETLELKTEIYISPPNYTVEALAYSENCSACNSVVTEAMNTFNRTQAASAFDGITCECETSWQQLIDENQPTVLLTHIAFTFQTLLEKENLIEGIME